MNPQVMILAAGRGERLRPLTDHCPKPLVKVAGISMLERHVRACAAMGLTDIVMNHAWLGAQIPEALGDGSRFGVRIQYSAEGETGLETGGGIYRALQEGYLRGDAPFIVINGDIVTDYPFINLKKIIQHWHENILAHLVLIDNRPHHPNGDFYLIQNHIYSENIINNIKHTFSGMGVYAPALFAGTHPDKFPLAPLLKNAMANQAVTGEHYAGAWFDVGTLARLAEAEAWVHAQA